MLIDTMSPFSNPKIMNIKYNSMHMYAMICFSVVCTVLVFGIYGTIMLVKHFTKKNNDVMYNISSFNNFNNFSSSTSADESVLYIILGSAGFGFLIGCIVMFFAIMCCKKENAIEENSII